MVSFGQFIEAIGIGFCLYPLAFVLKPLVSEVLTEHNKVSWRLGTKLIPPLVLWLVLGLVIRRDKNTKGVLSWMVEGCRWQPGVPKLLPEHHLVSDGAISHARKRLGLQIFIDLFRKVVGLIEGNEPDFHGRRTAMFDGTTANMPDTEANKTKFTKPGSRSGESAYPRMRIMMLMVLGVRMILDISYAPYRGKGTGEKNLIRQILPQISHTNLLILMDAGLYAFDILWNIKKKQCDFLLKVPNTVKNLKPIRYFSDGSYTVRIYGKLLDIHASPTPTGRQKWLDEYIEVRIIPVNIPGFRPFLLMTTILESKVTALELAQHYHRRWDIEIAYDEMKTHLCVTLRGQSPTTFRSKLPLLVEQELYALAIVYNTVRHIISLSAKERKLDPCNISFLDALSHLIDSAPTLTALAIKQDDMKTAWLDLIQLIATCHIDRPRRKRAAPRVVKIKMSKFNRKQPSDQSVKRDYATEIHIKPPPILLPLKT